MAVNEDKLPLYMKWWVWILIFLVTAVIVNYTADYIDDYARKSNSPASLVMKFENIENNDLTVTALVSPPVATTFLVGNDFPAGEYFVQVNVDGFGYLLLTRSKNLVYSEIIWQQHLENHTIINLVDGHYLTTKNITLIPVDSAVVPNFDEGILPAGTYRVGKDIPPGVYTLFPLEDKTGFFSTAATSNYLDAHIFTKQNFNEPITIALNLGDYLTFIRAEIRK